MTEAATITTIAATGNMAGATGPLLLDANGAAALVGIGRSNLFRLLSDGSFPAPIPLGKRRLWRSAELVAWTSSGCPPRCRWTWPPNGKI